MLFVHKKGEVRKQLFDHQPGIDWLMTWLKQTGTEAFWWFDFQVHHCGKSSQNQNVVFVFVFVFVFVLSNKSNMMASVQCKGWTNKHVVSSQVHQGEGSAHPGEDPCHISLTQFLLLRRLFQSAKMYKYKSESVSNATPSTQGVF